MFKIITFFILLNATFGNYLLSRNESSQVYDIVKINETDFLVFFREGLSNIYTLHYNISGNRKSRLKELINFTDIYHFGACILDDGNLLVISGSDYNMTAKIFDLSNFNILTRFFVKTIDSLPIGYTSRYYIAAISDKFIIINYYAYRMQADIYTKDGLSIKNYSMNIDTISYFDIAALTPDKFAIMISSSSIACNVNIIFNDTITQKFYNNYWCTKIYALSNGTYMITIYNYASYYINRFIVFNYTGETLADMYMTMPRMLFFFAFEMRGNDSIHIFSSIFDVVEIITDLSTENIYNISNLKTLNYYQFERFFFGENTTIVAFSKNSMLPFFRIYSYSYGKLNNPSQCEIPMFEYPDHSCGAYCAYPYSPLYTQNTQPYQYCTLTCPDINPYLYRNNTCNSDCESPYVSNLTAGNTCSHPCPNFDYFYFAKNQTCLSNCSSPYIIRQDFLNFKSCDAPCTNGTYNLTWENTCITSCRKFEIFVNNSDYGFCEHPCANTSHFYYFNTSCSLNCSSPFISRLVNSIKFCDYPCLAGRFLHWNDTCITNCSFPMQFTSPYGYNSCFECVSGYMKYQSRCVEIDLNYTVAMNTTNIVYLNFKWPMNMTFFNLGLIRINYTVSAKFSYNITILNNQTILINVLVNHTVDQGNLTIEIDPSSIISGFNGNPLFLNRLEIKMPWMNSTCNENCQNCDNISICLICKTNYSVFLGKCYPDYMGAYMMFSQVLMNPNQFFIQFTRDIILPIADYSEFFIFKLSKTDPKIVNYTITVIDNHTIELYVYTTSNLPYQTASLQLKEGLWMTPFIFNLYESISVTPILSTETVKAVKSVITSIQSPAGTSFFAVIFTANPSLILLVQNLLQSFYYLLYLNIELPIILVQVIYIFRIVTLNLAQFAIFDQYFDPYFTSSEIEFQGEKIGSDFIINSSGYLAVFALLFFFQLISKTVILMVRVGFFRVKRYMRYYTLNFREMIFDFWMSSIMNLSINSTLQFLHFNTDNSFHAASSVLAILFFIINFCCSGYVYIFIKKNPISILKKMKLHNLMKRKFLDEYFDHIKSSSKLARFYLAFVAFRRLASGVAIVMFYGATLIQIKIQVAISAGFLLFLALTNPYKERKMNVRIIFEELSFVITFIMVWMIYLNFENIDMSLNFAWVIIYILLINLVLNAVLTLMVSVEKLILMIKGTKYSKLFKIRKSLLIKTHQKKAYIKNQLSK